MAVEPTVEELREWSAREIMGWTLQPAQFGCIPGNTRMAFISIKDDEIIREHLVENWLPDKPTSGLIWIVIDKLTEMGMEIIIRPHIKRTFVQAFYKTRWFEGYDENPCKAILKTAWRAWHEDRR